MEEIEKIADQLEQESETFRNLAAGATAGEVRLPPSTVEGLAMRFAQMSESLRKMAIESRQNEK
jgi:hypothetical protein